MRLLMIVPYYEPDLGPSAPLFTLLSQELVNRGHQVVVITTVPHYPTGYVTAEYQGKLIYHSSSNCVEVHRVSVPSVSRANLAKRLLQFFCYQIGATLVGIGQKYDAVLVANPALWVWLPFFFHVYLRRKPAIFSIHDVFPDVGINLGIFRSKPVIWVVAWLERFCLSNAKFVRILSDSFKPGLRALGVPDEKLALIYDWVDIDLIQPINLCNRFAEENQLCDKFVILYAGNIGFSQGLENVLFAAKWLAEQDHLVEFVFVGEGAERQQLMAQAAQLQLANVRFLPFQPRERLSEVLATANIALVPLRTGIGFGSLPSKTYSILASGRPLLASVDAGTEIRQLIEEAEAGFCVPPEDAVALANAILALKNDPELCQILGRNGRHWAELHHSPKAAAKRFEDLFISAIGQHHQMETQ